MTWRPLLMSSLFTKGLSELCLCQKDSQITNAGIWIFNLNIAMIFLRIKTSTVPR